MADEAVARRIVATLLDDMNDRRGFRQNWDQIDTDTQQEIIAEWRRLVVEVLRDAD